MKRLFAALLTALALTACGPTTADEPVRVAPAHGEPGHNHTTDHQP